MKIFRLIFGKIDMISNFVTQAFNVMGTILIIFVMIVVNADVIGRELFLSPIAGVPMMVSMSIVAIVFLQTPQTFRQGRLTQNEAILNSIGNRSRFIKLFIEITYALAAFYLVLQIFQATYPMFLKSWIRNTYEGTVGDFTAPIWPIKLIILLGCFLLMVQIILFGFRKILNYSEIKGDIKK
jgi:TRAP-type mannitol/chloroaromatic compound transport system permease small subunit|tara:strand:+ start:16 stop:561 length:546 start_codon:yes stop_codon:yes gene_type:complete